MKIDQEKFISVVEAYHELSFLGDQKGINQHHHEFKNQKSEHQTTFHETYFSMTFYDNRKVISSTIVCTFSSNK